jgi:uncharacterized protein YgbK (DUF1537 family)
MYPRPSKHYSANLRSASSTPGGVTRVIVAGGETSGSVVNALGIKAVEILGTIDPGVPALKALGSKPLRLALKSGNFGAPDFFLKTMQKWNQ